MRRGLSAAATALRRTPRTVRRNLRQVCAAISVPLFWVPRIFALHLLVVHTSTIDYPKRHYIFMSDRPKNVLIDINLCSIIRLHCTYAILKNICLSSQHIRRCAHAAAHSQYSGRGAQAAALLSVQWPRRSGRGALSMQWPRLSGRGARLTTGDAAHRPRRSQRTPQNRLLQLHAAALTAQCSGTLP